MRSKLFLSLALFASLSLLLTACERRLIQVATQEGGGLSILSATATAERTASLHELQGVVETRPNDANPWQAAEEGQTLLVESQVRTGVDGRVLFRLTEGSKVRLVPDTFFSLKLLNPFLDSKLTSLHLEKGTVFVLLKDGALDVETPLGIASARSAYMSTNFDAKTLSVNITCLQGTCSFGSLFIPAGFKLVHAEQPNAAPVRMEFADYGVWGVTVPEATQLAGLATEAVVQGSATVPVVATTSPTASPVPSVTSPPSSTPAPTETSALGGATEPVATVARPTTTFTPIPSLTSVPLRPTITAIPFTPIPPAPIIGRHLVMVGETLFCIARGYGVLPAAIAQANGLSAPFIVFAGQVLNIPAVQWTDIQPGPVCAPQFVSPFPGIPFETATPLASDTPVVSPTPAAPPLVITIHILCIFNCGSQDGDYIIQVDAQASGGVEPYTYTPGQSFTNTSAHCFPAGGTVTVTSADGQTASATWNYQDASCPPTAAP